MTGKLSLSYKSIARRLQAKQYTKKPHSLHCVQDIYMWSLTEKEAITALFHGLNRLHLDYDDSIWKSSCTGKLVSLIAYQWQGLLLSVTLSHRAVLTAQRMSSLSFKCGSHDADDLLISLQKLWSSLGQQRHPSVAQFGLHIVNTILAFFNLSNLSDPAPCRQKYRKVKRPTVTRSQPQDTSGLSLQCSATELWQKQPPTLKILYVYCTFL